jgi:hypothetical protein
MQNASVVKIGNHVAVINVPITTLDGKKISNYLINKYSATYLSFPLNIYVVPNTTVEELENDINIILPEKEVESIKLPRRTLPKRTTLVTEESEIKKLPKRVLPKRVSPRRTSPERKILTSAERNKNVKSMSPRYTLSKKLENDIMEIDSLEKIADYYNKSTNPVEVKNILDDSSFFEKLREKHQLTYINTFDELLKLKEELGKTEKRTRIHYKNIVEEFKIGDRVIFNDINYKILKSSNTEISMQEVNIFGETINQTIKLGILTHNEYTGKYRKWIWYDSDMSKSKIFFDTDTGIRHGIVLYNYGPKIYSLDSLFLKYKTLPYKLNDNKRDGLEEINMLVSVQNSEESLYTSFVYLIVDIFDDGALKLEFVDKLNREKMKEGAEVIIAERIPNPGNSYKWDTKILGKCTIIIGSWYSGFDPPR